MPLTFAAQIADWGERTKENQSLVLRESVQDVMEQAQKSQQSMVRGATGVKYGAIPVDTGFLQNTIASDLNGSGDFVVDAAGTDFELTIAGMESGDTAHFAWTAVYARAVNYGHGTYPGAHWVEAAAAQWRSIVAKNAKRFRP